MSGSTLHAVLGVPIALVALWALASSSIRVAASMLPGSRLVTVGVATIVVAHAQLLLLFELLGAVRAFRLPFVLLALVAMAIASRRLLPAVKVPFRPFFTALDRSTRVLLLAAIALLVFKALRGMVAPTLSMDGAVYHIPRAVLWLHGGGFARLGAPDVLEITDFHPPAGDLPWTYALLCARNESLVGWASVLIVAEAWVSAYAAARLMAAERSTAAIAALAIVCTPAVMVYAGSPYVDNAMLAFAVCGVALLIDATDKPTLGRALLVSASFALAASTKVSAALLIPLALVASTLAARKNLRASWAVGWLGGALLMAPHVVRCMRLRGSPIYPIGLTLFGRKIFAANETFELLATAKMFPARDDDPLQFISLLLAPWLRPMDTTGFGPAFLLIAPLGLVGVTRLPRERRWLGAFLLGVATLFLGSVWSPSALAYRTEYAIHTGRYLTPAIAALVLLSTAWTRARWPLFVCAAASLIFSLPRGLGSIDLTAIAPVAVALGAALGLLAIVRRSRFGGVVCVVLGAWITHVVALGARAVHRDDYLVALARRAIYDIHRVAFVPPGTSRVWRALDRQPPARIAIAAGWDGTGMQLMVAPLLGGELQHVHTWITPTADGSVLDYRREAEVRARGSYDAWMGRLREQRVDIVACLAPPGLERWWIETHRSDFEPIAASDDGTYAAFRVLSSSSP